MMGKDTQDHLETTRFLIMPFKLHRKIVIVHTRQGVQITHQNMVMQTLAIGYDGEMFARAFGNYQVQLLYMWKCNISKHFSVKE